MRPLCAVMAKSNDKELLTDGCWTLSHIMENEAEVKVQAFLESGAIPLLVKLLEYAFTNLML